ncbi:MAG TPA: hypothetical protein VGX76_06285 [Pirellulales bacterium]|nr:hypothetical protein [Pirellulales bacterium]
MLHQWDRRDQFDGKAIWQLKLAWRGGRIGGASSPDQQEAGQSTTEKG